jgi:hypothetical protein
MLVRRARPTGSWLISTADPGMAASPNARDEELLEGLSMPAYRRIATLIRLPGRPGSTVLGYVVDIDAAELTAALEKDAGACSGLLAKQKQEPWLFVTDHRQTEAANETAAGARSARARGAMKRRAEEQRTDADVDRPAK